jgi:hypothetical protein
MYQIGIFLYYILPRLRSNIISIGQLDEIDVKTLVEDGIMSLFGRQRRVIASVRRMPYLLYPIYLTLRTPMSLLAQAGDVA